MSEPDLVLDPDPFDARRVLAETALLGAFNAAGVLAAADVHVARRLTALTGEADERVQLAIALAVRGPRLGHVYVDLQSVSATATAETEAPADLTGLPWPEPAAWLHAVRASPLVASGSDASAAARPLRLEGPRLYLDRYWREELRLAVDLSLLAAQPAAGVDGGALAAGVARLFPDAPPGDRQPLAAACAVLRRFAVVAGGPGTGKTTTIARVAALLLEQAAAHGAPPPLIALTAPTGKAAARLQESLHAEAATLAVAPAVREGLLELDAVTLHRLLGWRPDSSSRFGHHRGNRLPHDVVIVDETSMVSLTLMSRLVEAIRPDARLVLVGDPGQLTSIEAGAVLGDIVGPARAGLTMTPDARAALQEATGRKVTVTAPPAGRSIGDGIVVLDRGHRFGGTIAGLATAIAAGDADTALAVLASEAADVTWLDLDVATASPTALALVREQAVGAARAVLEAAAAGDAPAALQALGAFRVLCAHRRGPSGAAHWMTSIARWLAADLPARDLGAEWYVGRPLLVTQNDYSLKLYNGDTGVVVAAEHGRITAAFDRRGDIVTFSPTRLEAVDTVYAMTIHKSQGSQFGIAAVLLPPPDSPILTRELLYTAVTRARDRLIVAGTEASIRQAVGRPAARASGLGERLWSAGGSG